LTLDVGLRYEYDGTWSTGNGLLSMFDPSNGDIVVPNGSLAKVSSLMPTAYVPVVTAGSVGLPNSLINGDKGNFAPRFGIAWRPFGGDKTVFRGGYGIFFSSLAAQPSVSGVPFAISVPTYTNTKPAPTIVLPQVFPAAAASGPSTVSLPSAINLNIKTPYSEQ